MYLFEFDSRCLPYKHQRQFKMMRVYTVRSVDQ